MAYQLEISALAARAIAAQEEAMRERLRAKLLGLAETPRPKDSKKLKGRNGEYRVRVGDLRIVYIPDDKARIVRVTTIQHRREVYR